MDQQKIGQFIAQKRKEHNMTQVQLAEKIGVTNKTISKWENGKCMPDYSVMEELCCVLDISVSALLNGENAAIDKDLAEKQTLAGLKRISELEKERTFFIGIGLIFMGMLLFLFSKFPGGTSVQDFMSGLLFGMSAAVILTGIFLITKALAQNFMK